MFYQKAKWSKLQQLGISKVLLANFSITENSDEQKYRLNILNHIYVCQLSLGWHLSNMNVKSYR